MSGFVLSPLAQADIDGIWDYTADHWNEQQADAYVGVIRAAIERVAKRPQLGRACDKLRAGYRRIDAGSHVVFFRVNGDVAEVIRILHESMDFDRHL